MRPWTPDASLAPYISFDPRTGFLTFLAPPPPPQQVIPQEEYVNPEYRSEEEDPKYVLRDEIAALEVHYWRALEANDVDNANAIEKELDVARRKLAELEGTQPEVMIDLATSPPPILPQRNDTFAIERLLPRINFQKSFLDAFDDFFSCYGKELQTRLREDLLESSDTEAKAKVRSIVEYLYVRFQYPNRRYAILSHVADDIYKEDNVNAHRLREILVRLMQQYTAAKKTIGPSPPPPAMASPRVAMSETTQLYMLILKLEIPDGASVVFTEQLMGVHDWTMATPVAFLSNKGDKESQFRSVLKDIITKALLPDTEWRVTYPFSLGQIWSKYTTSLLYEDNLPKVTMLEAAPKKEDTPRLKFLPLGDQLNDETYNLQKGGRISVSTFATQKQGLYAAFAVHVPKKKEELQQLVGIYIFTRAIKQ